MSWGVQIRRQKHRVTKGFAQSHIKQPCHNRKANLRSHHPRASWVIKIKLLSQVVFASQDGFGGGTSGQRGSARDIQGTFSFLRFQPGLLRKPFPEGTSDLGTPLKALCESHHLFSDIQSPHNVEGTMEKHQIFQSLGPAGKLRSRQELKEFW